MRIVITRPEGNKRPDTLLAEAEIIFDEDGPLYGLKLVGFSIWEPREEGADPGVTFPARPYKARNGENKSFWYLKDVERDGKGTKALREAILDEFDRFRDEEERNGGR